MRNIKQNLLFAFIYNALGVPIAAEALYPFFGILLSPIHRRRGHEFQFAFGVGNALRLRKISITLEQPVNTLSKKKAGRENPAL